MLAVLDHLADRLHHLLDAAERDPPVPPPINQLVAIAPQEADARERHTEAARQDLCEWGGVAWPWP